MARLVTTRSFIEKAKLTHGDTYDYSKTVYKSTKSKVIIICPVHGEFLQSPSNHYQFGCLDCGVGARAQKKRLVSEEALSSLVLKHGEFLYPNFRDLFTTTKQKINILCRFHGEFVQKYENHLAGQKCPYCRYSGADGLTTLYLCGVTNASGKAVKVGVTSEKDSMVRLKHLTHTDKEILYEFRIDSKVAVRLEDFIKAKYCSLDCFKHERVKGEFFEEHLLHLVVGKIREVLLNNDYL